MKIRFIISIVLFIIVSQIVNAQKTATIRGRVIDKNSSETLPGTNVLIQGTSFGTITDFDGVFELNNLSAGSYNLVISFVSYKNKIERITVSGGQTVELNVELESSDTEIVEINIVSQRKRDTEISSISSMRTSNLVTSNISSQQIMKSQDKDASEVIRRVPGITITDGRFVVVRGLIERYSTVWLNGSAAPSSESDSRAFSFDIIPSSLIENIQVYKTTAPELPADFAGAAIQITTKNNAERNSLEVSYSTAYNQGTTFQKFYTYDGSNTDFLGFDNGKRSLPSNFPSTTELRQMQDNPTEADKERVKEIGRSFNKVWSPVQKMALPNQSFSIGGTSRFLIGNVSVGNTSSINYSNSYDNNSIFRSAYQAYDEINDRVVPSYYFNDEQYTNSVKVGLLSNFSFIFGNNQKIEFRNLFNQQGESKTTLRTGEDYYGGKSIQSHELAYQSRAIYSSQIAGTFKFNADFTKWDWIIGYSHANKLQPDIRRVETNRNSDELERPYYMGFNFNADPKFQGRLFMDNNENIWTATTNWEQNFVIGSMMPVVKAGFYTELKNRDFSARNIGYAIANISQFDWSLGFKPVNEVFVDENINSTTGIKIDESTNLSDSYNAINKLFAAYTSVLIPTKKLKVYAGVRAEQNLQQLNSYNEFGEKVAINNNTLDLFPSVNSTLNFTEKMLVRFAYGRSVNRPEFREIAPFAFYNFQDKATYYGNPDLKNAYINNYDFRFEAYPTTGQIISVGVFYKKFENPIEAHLKDFGTGWNYKYYNSDQATSIGAEVDIRKTLTSFENFLSDITLVMNASIIKSVVTTNDPTERTTHRAMQGQSPYIINTGIYYNNEETRWMASLLYNRIGERIAFVGDKNNPHIYEVPRNSLDFTLHKGIGHFIQLKLGVKDVLNSQVAFKQYQNISQKTDGAEVTEVTEVTRNQDNVLYNPGRLVNFGIGIKF